MDKPPIELYLQTHDDDGDEVGEITFCYDNVYRCDTRYIRADIVDDLLAALKAVEWIYNPKEGQHECPWCRMLERDGHWHDCKRQISITRAESQAG